MCTGGTRVLLKQVNSSRSLVTITVFFLFFFSFFFFFLLFHLFVNELALAYG